MHSRTAARTANLQLRQLGATTLTVMIGLLAAAPRAAAQQAEPPRFENVTADAAPKQEQQHAIEHSDAFYTRLTIHRYGSYIELPLFGAEYWLGQKLFNGVNVPTWAKPAHGIVAGTLGGLFAVNTVTGVWNLVEARNDPNKVRRYLHSALMLAADAGFAYTGLVTAHDAGEGGEGEFFGNFGGNNDGASRHRNAALVSIGTATAGTLLMWLWKD